MKRSSRDSSTCLTSNPVFSATSAGVPGSARTILAWSGVIMYSSICRRRLGSLCPMRVISSWYSSLGAIGPPQASVNVERIAGSRQNGRAPNRPLTNPGVGYCHTGLLCFAHLCIGNRQTNSLGYLLGAPSDCFCRVRIWRKPNNVSRVSLLFVMFSSYPLTHYFPSAILRPVKKICYPSCTCRRKMTSCWKLENPGIGVNYVLDV